MAATVGCRSSGIEIVKNRHDMGLQLVKSFDSVLKEVSSKRQRR